DLAPTSLTCDVLELESHRWCDIPSEGDQLMNVRPSLLAILILFLLAIAARPLRAQAADPNMTAEERAHVVKLLQDSQKEYLSYIENVSEAQGNWKPAPDRWSVGETAQHILLSETALFGAVERALAAPANADWEKATAGKTELLERVMPDR